MSHSSAIISSIKPSAAPKMEEFSYFSPASNGTLNSSLSLSSKWPEWSEWPSANNTFSAAFSSDSAEDTAPSPTPELSINWTWPLMIRITLYVVIFFASLTGNTIVIITLSINKRMRSVTNAFLLNLAISDLLLGIFCMPVTLIGSILRKFIFGRLMCKLIPYLQAISVGVSVWTLVAISLERYFAICRPLKSRQWQTMSHSYKMIALIWIINLIIMSPIAILSDLVPTMHPGRMKCRELWPDKDMERGFNIWLDIVLLLVPLVIMSTTYTFVSKALCALQNLTCDWTQYQGHTHLHYEHASSRSDDNANELMNGMKFSAPKRTSGGSHSTTPSENEAYGTQPSTFNNTSPPSNEASASENGGTIVLEYGGTRNRIYSKGPSASNMTWSLKSKFTKSKRNVNGNKTNGCDYLRPSPYSSNVTTPMASSPEIQTPVIEGGETSTQSSAMMMMAAMMRERSGSGGANGANGANGTNNQRGNGTQQRNQLLPTTSKSDHASPLSASNVTSPSISARQSLLQLNRRMRFQEKSKKRIIKMLGVLVIEFFICWTPLFVVNTWSQFDPYQVYTTIGSSGISIIHLLSYVSCCINPLTYCFMHRKFRKAFMGTLRCRKRQLLTRQAARILSPNTRHPYNEINLSRSSLYANNRTQTSRGSILMTELISCQPFNANNAVNASSKVIGHEPLALALNGNASSPRNRRALTTRFVPSVHIFSSSH